MSLEGRRCKVSRYHENEKGLDQEGVIVDSYVQKKTRIRKQGIRVLIRVKYLGEPGFYYFEKYLDEIKLL